MEPEPEMRFVLLDGFHRRDWVTLNDRPLEMPAAAAAVVAGRGAHLVAGL